MTNLQNEKIVNYLVMCDKPGRKFTSEPDNRWGGLLEPDSSENPDKKDSGLRVALFASWDFGYLVLETLKEFEKEYPGELNIVGLVTDDPLNPDAKISVRKRIWSQLDQPSRVIDETFAIESALSDGIPVYTGEIKIESFHRLIEKWNPEAILVCVFGQVIDSFIIHFPAYGIYNFHPSDLSQHHGAGPAPYDDLAARHAGTTVWSVHQLTEEIDSGEVVGTSPPVNVLDEKGELPLNPLVVYDKLAEALSPLAFFLVKELERNFELKKHCRIDHIDFDKMISEKEKSKLLQPVTRGFWTDVLSIPDDFLFKLR